MSESGTRKRGPQDERLSEESNAKRGYFEALDKSIAEVEEDIKQYSALLEQKIDHLNKLKSEQRKAGERLSDDIIRVIMSSVLVSEGAATVATFQLLCKNVATAVVGIGGKQKLIISEGKLNQFSINGCEPKLSLRKIIDNVATAAALYDKNVLHCIRFQINLAKCGIRNLYLKQKVDFVHNSIRTPRRSKIYALLLESDRILLKKYIDHWTDSNHDDTIEEFVDLVVKNSPTLLTLETRAQYYLYSHIPCNLKRLSFQNFCTALYPRPGIHCKHLTIAKLFFIPPKRTNSRHNSWLECIIKDTGAEEINFTEIGQQFESILLNHLLHFSDQRYLQSIKKLTISDKNLLDLLTTDQKAKLLSILPGLS